MIDVISIGTVTIDLYYKGESLTHDKDRFELAIGGKYFVDHFYEGLGGGGANVAVGIVKNGLTSALIAQIGENPFKKVICDKLDLSEIQYKDFCTFKEDYMNISSIFLTEKGEKTIVNYRTPHQHITTSKGDYELLKKAKSIYMGNLSTVSLEERIDLLKYAKNNGINTFVNLNVTDCRRSIDQIRRILADVDVFIINTHEFADIVKTSYESIDFHSKVTAKYEPFREDQLLVLTDGPKGSYAYFQKKVYHEPAVLDVKVLDTTGAGDAFTAGFIAEYLKSEGDIQSSMKNGSEYAVNILKKLGSN